MSLILPPMNDLLSCRLFFMALNLWEVGLRNSWSSRLATREEKSWMPKGTNPWIVNCRPFWK